MRGRWKMTAIMRSESHRERSGGAKTGMKRSAATTITPKAAITVITQATRMMRIHDLQGGGSSAQYPSRLDQPRNSRPTSTIFDFVGDASGGLLDAGRRLPSTESYGENIQIGIILGSMKMTCGCQF